MTSLSFDAMLPVVFMALMGVSMLIYVISDGYISGFGTGWNYPLFAAAIAVALPMAYVLVGAAWLIMKTEGELQARAVQWAKTAWAPMVGGLILISMATPWISATVRGRWFALP